MAAKKAVGRPLKVDYKIIIKLADAIQHNTNITDACRYAGISRDTFYRHMNNEEVFAEKMAVAKDNQNKVVFSFLTVELFS
jgi:ACT domain-containing protein